MKAAYCACLASLVLIGGCATPQSIVDSSQVLKTHGDNVRQAMPEGPLPVTSITPGTATAAAVASVPRDVARRASKPWHGTRLQEVQSNEVLPAVFQSTTDLSFDDKATGGRVSIAIVAERLSRVTGVPVRVAADVYAGQGQGVNGAPMGRPIQMATPMPAAAAAGGPLPIAGGIQGSAEAGPAGNVKNDARPVAPVYRQPLTDVSSVEMRWSGTVAGFLDHVTARLGVSWAYRDGVVVIERYQTETFELPVLAGAQDYKMSLASGEGTSSSGQNTGTTGVSGLDLSESGKTEILSSLLKAIQALVSGSGGNVVLNEGSGRFLVTAPREVMSRVRQIVRAEDEALRRQAHIQLDIYSVVNNDADEAGVNWNVVMNNLPGVLGITTRSPTTLTSDGSGAVTFTIAGDNGRFNGTNAVLNLLRQYGTSVAHRPVSMIAMNRQWARKANVTSHGYLSETTPSVSTTAGGGTPGLKTSYVVTGDKYMAQPAILDDGTIVLRLGVSLTEFLEFFKGSAGKDATAQTVFAPNTAGTGDQDTIRVRPGETTVITGLSRRVMSSDRKTLGGSLPTFLGGSTKATFKREDFMIVVRATQM